jgi:hypothetical protein
LNARWNYGPAEFKYSAESAALAREIILECGEDPDVISTQEMNKKHHRFVCFDRTIDVHNWSQVVSHGADLPLDGLTPHLCLVQFDHKRRGAQGQYRYRLLRPDELPEYGPDPGNLWGSHWHWGCLRCWGTVSGRPEWYDKNFEKMKHHLASSLVSLRLSTTRF